MGANKFTSPGGNVGIYFVYFHFENVTKEAWHKSMGIVGTE